MTARACQACGSVMPVRHGRPPRLCDSCKASPPLSPTVEGWAAAFADGTASARCDELVREAHARRGIPMRLVDALIGAERRAA